MSEHDQMPDRLGPYRLLDRIGEGGMGVVFLARDAEQRSVALKVLRPGVAGEPTARRRLAREVETMRRVRSPHVAEVIDADLTGDMPYIVTRYVPGRTLDQVVAEDGPLQRAALAQLARGLAEALVAVHAAGVVHRDLKPGNVMLVNSMPVVIDFGIAQGADTTRLTMTGMFMGTPGYLSPEVIEGHPSSEASDVHAWGATVAFAATGRPPFGTGPYETIFYRIVNGQPDLAGVPAPLSPLLSAALARDPAGRPAAAALGAAAAGLDPGALVTSALPMAGPDARMGAQPTRADLAAGGSPEAVPTPGGAAPGVPVGPDGLPAMDGLSGWGAAAAGLGGAAPSGGGALSGGVLQPGTRPFASAPLADDYSDLLTPASYQPVPPAGGAAPPGPPAMDPGSGAVDGAGGAGARARAASPRGHAVLAVSAMALLVGLGVVLPVLGTTVAVALIVALRAGELGHTAAVRRRARGSRGHLALSALAFPWFLLRSLLACLMLTPFAVAAGAVAFGASYAAAPGQPLARGIAFAAGALVAFYGLGPGSSRSRRQLGRLFAALTPTRLAQAVAITGMVMLATAVLAAAVTSASVFWPARPPERIVRLGVVPGGTLHQFGLVARYVIARFRSL